MVDLQWLIGGQAGYGIMTIGVMMSKIFTRLGLSVFDYVEYPSLIRGGHNAYYVRASDVEIFSQKRPVDILVALNRETINKHINELSENAAIIYDPNITKVEASEFTKKILLVPVPLLEITKQVNADKLMINTVAVGASLALFHSNFSVLEKIIQDAFGRKGENVIAENINTSKAGFDFVLKNFQGKYAVQVQEKPAYRQAGPQENLLISGAEAISISAIKAGLKFAAIYPMTPINGVLATLVSKANKYSLVVKEPEDEISGICMAIGAAYGGVRSMVATAGGGFSLMVEALGFAAQSEVPIVIVEGMRPGPSTGLPTWTGQGDLRFVLHASQDEFPRVIVAPGDMLEAFTQTLHAFNLAEKYQIPVIILVDKYLMEGHQTVQSSKFKVQSDEFKIDRGKTLKNEDVVQLTDYKRYQFEEDGVSSRSIPGQKGGVSLTDSYEHDERGLYNEEIDNRIKMVEKRAKKMDSIVKEIPDPVVFGDKESDITILGFGTTKMPVLEAMKELAKENINVNFVHTSYLNPFPVQYLTNVINEAKKTVVIEGNMSGQFEGLIKEKTGLSVNAHFRKFDGRPFYPEEIVEKVKTILSS